MVIGKLIPAVVFMLAFALAAEAAQQDSQFNVRRYGAKGDGKTDDTKAFQKALDEAGKAGGVVLAPAGEYLIATHLSVPADVTLEGVTKAPISYSDKKGTTLLAVEGAGSEEGAPFIMLHHNSAIRGLAVFYPKQDPENIKPYPWCVQGQGDNCSVVDCLLVNPYNGVDFGTHPCGRHHVRNLNGQPLRRGLYVDQCYDIGRVENVHFWPFWNQKGAVKFNNEYGETFIFGRTDWEYVYNTFMWGYNIGYRFIGTKAGAANGNFLGIGADACNICVLVEATQPMGLLITNGEFVAFIGDEPTEIKVAATNTGAVQFQNCAFWGPAARLAVLEGNCFTSFQNCNFQEWDAGKKGLPGIEASNGSLSLIGNYFVPDKAQLKLNAGVKSAVVMGNTFRGTTRIANDSKGKVEIGMNVER